MIRVYSLLALLLAATSAAAFVVRDVSSSRQTITSTRLQDSLLSENENPEASSRRTFLSVSALAAATAMLPSTQKAEAIGPVRIDLTNPRYTARPCPKDRPIPGEKAMKGMRGLCVTVEVDMKESPPKDLEKVGVYGFITYDNTGESVLANNPDLSTDAGQFAMIESVKSKDKKTTFEFIAAVPQELDLSKFDNGIGNLKFEALRLINFPGGQQYGAISPCEMNEFSDECEAWEAENGEFKRGDYMVKRNARNYDE